MVLAWEPLTDLPEDWSTLTDGELTPLLQFWNDQRADLEQSGALNVFTCRLNREWSIETGQIEGVYNIDRGITETLIERGIRSDLIPTEPGQRPPEIIAAIIQDHLDVLEGLFQVIKGDRALTKGYIHELHAGLLRHQDTTTVQDQFGNFFSAQLLKGRYKERPNNPKRSDGSIHQYAPPEQVDSEMERLLDLHRKHEQQGVPVEVEAAWLHHRFTQIHPYQDGNGRVARALASLIFMKAGWFPVVVTRDDRTRYIDALEKGDEGDLRPLTSYFVDVQKRALFQAIRTVSDLKPSQTVEDAIAAARRVLTSPIRNLDPSSWTKVKDTADRLMFLAELRLEKIASSLVNEIGESRPDFQFRIVRSREELQGAYLSVGLLRWVANTEDYRVTRGIALIGPNTSHIAIDAMGIESKVKALIGIIVRFIGHDRETQLASEDGFVVSYSEPDESAERRFHPWLEQSLVNALTLWRKTL